LWQWEKEIAERGNSLLHSLFHRAACGKNWLANFLPKNAGLRPHPLEQPPDPPPPSADSMRLLVLTGFFGSGKTTFLIRALRLATREAGLRAILVQNEIGRVGVDPEVFRSGDLEMKELLGGCICCDLATRLVSVLGNLVAENSADLVCVEASGLATPGLVRQILSGTDLASLPLLQVNILDAARLDRIQKVISLPVIRQGIETADLCIINKIDAAPADFRERFGEAVRDIRPVATLHYANLSSEETLPDDLAEPLREFFQGGGGRRLAGDGESMHHEHDHHGRPAVCALEVSLPPPFRQDTGKLRTAFDELIAGIGAAGGIIGHVKAALIADDGTRHLLNSTGIGQPESAPLPETVCATRAVINAIAWRIDQAALETLTRKFLQSLYE
jgi:G3E family GTPase